MQENRQGYRKAMFLMMGGLLIVFQSGLRHQDPPINRGPTVEEIQELDKMLEKEFPNSK